MIDATPKARTPIPKISRTNSGIGMNVAMIAIATVIAMSIFNFMVVCNSGREANPQPRQGLGVGSS